MISIDRKYSYSLVAAAIVIVVARLLMPGSPLLLTISGLFVIIGVQQYVFSRCRFATMSGRIALLAFSILMAVGLIANVYYFTTVSGGTDAAPILNNNDARRYWNEAIYYAGFGGEPFDIHGGLLGRFYSLIVSLTGPSITILSLICMALMVITLPIVASIAYCVTDDKKVATYAMIAAGSVCYFLASGCIIIKDAWIICGTAICARAICNKSGVSPGYLALGIVPIGIARTNYLLFIMIGIVVMGFFACRSKQSLYRSLLAIVICSVAYGVLKIENTTLAAQAYTQSGSFAHYAQIAPNQKAFFDIIGENTASYSVVKRLLLMPIAVVLQFLIPFPWNWMRDATFGYSYIYAHCAYPWYLFGGLLVYYLFAVQKKQSKILFALTMWGVICWLLPCYFTLGTVSRYGLPAVSLLAPCVGVVIRDCLRKRSLHFWLSAYTIVMAIGLIICYHLQNNA